MNRRVLLLSLVLVFSGCASVLDGIEHSLEESGVVSFPDKASVQVRGEGNGRGAVIDEDLVLTVDHVVGDRDTVMIATSGRDGWVEAQVVRRIPSSPEDLIVLRIELDDGWFGEVFGFSGFGRHYDLEPGGEPDRVATRRGRFTWEPGRLKPGDSGSPVLDAGGRLVGLVTGSCGDQPVMTPIPGFQGLEPTDPVLWVSARARPRTWN